MGSEDDAKDNESDQTGSEFGPPVGDFGRPVSGFGPPTADFGAPTAGQFGPPPVGDFGPPTREQPHWATPESAAEHPELVWRPAEEPPTVPPPPVRYRAPDSTDYGNPPAAPPPNRAPDPAGYGGGTPPTRPNRAPDPGGFGAPPPPPPPSSSAADWGLSDDESTVRHSTQPDKQRDSWWNRANDAGGVPKQPSGPSGLSWADDPIAQHLAAGILAAAAPPPRPPSRGRWIAIGILTAVVLIIALLVTFVAVRRDGAADPAPKPAASPTAAALPCKASQEDKVTVGNGPGNTASGVGAILGFQYAFYVERDGERVREFVAPDAENVSTAATIQQAIDDQIPVGTTHCLRIREVAVDTFEVDLTERRPSGATTNEYKQTITTVERDGKILIFAIRERL